MRRPSCSCCGDDFVGAVDAEDHVATPPHQLVVGPFPNPAHAEDKNAGIARIDQRVVCHDRGALQVEQP